MSDRGRSEVYAAELVAFDGTELEVVEPFDAVVAWVQPLLAGEWWPGGPVALRPARRDAGSSTTRWSPAEGGCVIRLAAAQCTRATAVHELAHVLAGADGGHGPDFRRAHVDVAAAAFGTERGGWLEVAYRQHGLDLAERSWSPPPTGEQTIAL